MSGNDVALAKCRQNETLPSEGESLVFLRYSYRYGISIRYGTGGSNTVFNRQILCRATMSLFQNTRDNGTLSSEGESL